MRLCGSNLSASCCLTGASVCLMDPTNGFSNRKSRKHFGIKRLPYEGFHLLSSVIVSVSAAPGCFQQQGRGYKRRPNPGGICHQGEEESDRDAGEIREEEQIKKQSPCCSPAPGVWGFERRTTGRRNRRDARSEEAITFRQSSLVVNRQPGRFTLFA